MHWYVRNTCKNNTRACKAHTRPCDLHTVKSVGGATASRIGWKWQSMPTTNTPQTSVHCRTKDHQRQTQSSLDKGKSELQKLEAKCEKMHCENKEVMDEMVLTKVQLQKLSALAFKQLANRGLTQEEEDHYLALALTESEQSVADAPAPANPESPARAPRSKPASPAAPPRGCCGLYANLAVSSSSADRSSSGSSSKIFHSSANPSSSSASTFQFQHFTEILQKCSKPQRPEILQEFAPPPDCNAHVVELAFLGLACSIHEQDFRQRCAACNEAMKMLEARAWAKEQPATGAAEGPAAAPAEEKPALPSARPQSKTTKRVTLAQWSGNMRQQKAQFPAGTWHDAEERATKFCSSSSKGK